MAGASIVIQDEEINAALARVKQAGGDTRDLNEAIAGHMLKSVQRRFEAETGPDGKAWRRLSPRTAARRRQGKRRAGKRRGHGHILRDRVRLYKSIVGEADSREARVGTNIVYAAIHQFGGAIKRPARQAKIRLRKVGGQTRFAASRHKRAADRDVTIPAHTIVMPARPYLGFSDDDRREILAIAETHFRRAAGATA